MENRIQGTKNESQKKPNTISKRLTIFNWKKTDLPLFLLATILHYESEIFFSIQMENRIQGTKNESQKKPNTISKRLTIFNWKKTDLPLFLLATILHSESEIFFSIQMENRIQGTKNESQKKPNTISKRLTIFNWKKTDLPLFLLATILHSESEIFFSIQMENRIQGTKNESQKKPNTISKRLTIFNWKKTDLPLFLLATILHSESEIFFSIQMENRIQGTKNESQKKPNTISKRLTIFNWKKTDLPLFLLATILHSESEIFFSIQMENRIQGTKNESQKKPNTISKRLTIFNWKKTDLPLFLLATILHSESEIFFSIQMENRIQGTKNESQKKPNTISKRLTIFNWKKTDLPLFLLATILHYESEIFFSIQMENRIQGTKNESQKKPNTISKRLTIFNWKKTDLPLFLLATILHYESEIFFSIQMENRIQGTKNESQKKPNTISKRLTIFNWKKTDLPLFLLATILHYESEIFFSIQMENRIQGTKNESQKKPNTISKRLTIFNWKKTDLPLFLLATILHYESEIFFSIQMENRIQGTKNESQKKPNTISKRLTIFNWKKTDLPLFLLATILHSESEIFFSIQMENRIQGTKNESQKKPNTISKRLTIFNWKKTDLPLFLLATILHSESEI